MAKAHIRIERKASTSEVYSYGKVGTLYLIAARHQRYSSVYVDDSKRSVNLALGIDTHERDFMLLLLPNGSVY